MTSLSWSHCSDIKGCNHNVFIITNDDDNDDNDDNDDDDNDYD